MRWLARTLIAHLRRHPERAGGAVALQLLPQVGKDCTAAPSQDGTPGTGAAAATTATAGSLRMSGMSPASPHRRERRHPGRVPLPDRFAKSSTGQRSEISRSSDPYNRNEHPDPSARHGERCNPDPWPRTRKCVARALGRQRFRVRYRLGCSGHRCADDMSPSLIIQFRQGEKIAAATLYREPGILAVRGVARQLDAMDNMINVSSGERAPRCPLPSSWQSAAA